MKLFTEKDVTEMILKTRKFGFTAEYLIISTQGIELPNDDEIEEGLFHQSNEYAYGYKDAFKWIKDKILNK